MGKSASFLNLEIGKEISNQDFVDIFEVGLQDGMRLQLLSK
jgi:hypothetical protein